MSFKQVKDLVNQLNNLCAENPMILMECPQGLDAGIEMSKRIMELANLVETPDETKVRKEKFKQMYGVA